MVLYKKRNRQIEKSRNHRNKSKHKWSINFLQGYQEDTEGKGSLFDN